MLLVTVLIVNASEHQRQTNGWGVSRIQWARGEVSIRVRLRRLSIGLPMIGEKLFKSCRRVVAIANLLLSRASQNSTVPLCRWLISKASLQSAAHMRMRDESGCWQQPVASTSRKRRRTCVYIVHVSSPLPSHMAYGHIHERTTNADRGLTAHHIKAYYLVVSKSSFTNTVMSGSAGPWDAPG